MGELIDYKKSYCYIWKWKRSKGKETLVDLQTEIKIYDIKIKQIALTEIIRGLRVYMSLSLT